MLSCYGKNCERETIAKGLCAKHYARLRRTGSVDNLIRQEYVLDGRTKHPLLKTYNGMKHRCLNPKYTYFRLYGGRGIKICDRWLDPITGFSNFVSDMGEKPSPKHSLDRIDSNGNYEPSNCKWSTPREQASNTSSNNKDVGVKKSGTGWLSYIKVKGEYRSKYFTDYDKGGWLESEKVNGDARVSGNAWVYGNAQVSGNAWVYGASLNAKKVFTKGKFVGRSDGNEEKLTVLHREACSNWDNTYVLGDYEISDIEEKEEPKDEEIIELNGKKYKLLEQS